MGTVCAAEMDVFDHFNRWHRLSFRTSSVTLPLDVSEPGATVERIAYGERIVLRPDPALTDRGYEKGEPWYF